MFQSLNTMIFAVAITVNVWLPAVTKAQSYSSLQPWAGPIEDYQQQATELKFTDFNRSITTLQVHGDRLWFGYGDGNRNLGTPLVIEFRYFSNPDSSDYHSAVVRGENQGAKQRTAFDTGEEQIEPFRVCQGTLYQAGVDSNSDDELWTQRLADPPPIAGNFFRLQNDELGAPVWEKFRSIPGGEHVHDVAVCDDALYAVGSGAANRAEWDSGKVFRYLWRSDDSGRTFQVAYREVCPTLSKTDTRFRHLLAVEKTLYAFGFVNPYVDQKPRQPVHLKKEGDRFTALTVAEHGAIATQLAVRTWNLRHDLGLVITRDPDREDRTRAFLAKPDGFHELTDWCSGTVTDGCWESDTRWLFLVSDPAKPGAYQIRRWDFTRAERTELVLDLGASQPSCIAVWHGKLFVGMRDGQIHRAVAAE